MSLIRSSRSEPAEWIVVRELDLLRRVRLPSGLSASSFARISSELSGVRSSCDMFARNSLLYFDESASCSAFSSSAERASSISRFLISIRAFCSASSARLLLELLVRLLELLLLLLEQLLGRLQRRRLLLELRVRPLQLLLLRLQLLRLALQLLGERLRLLEQLLGPHVRAGSC